MKARRKLRWPIIAIGLFVWIVVTWFSIHNIVEGVRERSLRDCPVVSGTIVSRKATDLFGIGLFSRSQFAIKITENNEIVHAITGRYLLDQIPEQVTFYYSGDRTKEVFLSNHEEDPLLIGLVCFVVFDVLWPMLILVTAVSATTQAERATMTVAQEETNHPEEKSC